MKKFKIGKHQITIKKVNRGKVESSGRPRAVFDLERAKRMHWSGKSYREIGKELGVSYSVIYRALNKLDS